MPVNSPKRRVSKVRKPQVCDGCGAVLPKGSNMLTWAVWSEGEKIRLRFCSRCQGVIYGCDARRSIDLFGEDDCTYICRNICECCDDYPSCGKVDYMRESQPGDLFFGDLPIPTE